jgi:acetyl-CoA carboxylase biotin carboxyl carrier protein
VALIPHHPQPEEQRLDESAATLSAAAEIADWPQQLETLRALAQVVREESLSQIEVEYGGVQFSLKALSSVAPNMVYAPFPVSGAPIEYSNAGATTPQFSSAPSPAASSAEKKAANGAPVVSPMVGLFYRAPSPNDPNFVEVGDRVEIGQTVGLIETMKVFNEITSETEGIVLEIKALSGALVETGDVLMTIG